MESVDFSLVVDGRDEKLIGFSLVQKQFIIRMVEQEGKSVFLWG